MLQELLRIYEESRVNPGTPKCTFAETLIFNEGWLLRAVLNEWRSHPDRSEVSFLPFPESATIYSEAQLYTPFKARRRGDKQAEGHTHVDGIVGDFYLAGKSGVVLRPGCRYLSVFEAKMYSPLSKGTTNVPNYDQVSRTAACIVHALLNAGPLDCCAAHLVVLYPQDSDEIQPSHCTREHIERQIGTRVRGYLSTEEYDEPNARFFVQWRDALPLIHVQFLTWEDVAAEMRNADLDRFYALCKRFNRS